MYLQHQTYKEEKYHFSKETKTPKKEEELKEFVNQTLKNRLYHSIQKKIDSLKQRSLRTEEEIRLLLYKILTEEEKKFFQNQKETQEWLDKSHQDQISESDYSCKEGQCTCKESEEEIPEETKEPEMIRSLDNIAESMVIICKQLKKIALELQTTSNMLKEVICKIDYREAATSTEKCQVMVTTKEINIS